MGKRTVTVVPTPGVLSALIVPLRASIIPRMS